MVCLAMIDYSLKLFVTLCVACATAIPLENFYPFGLANDALILANDDGSSDETVLSPPFPYFDVEYSTLFVNNNGDISFTASVSQFTPTPFPLSGDLALIAPYWADVDTTGTGTVWYRESTDAELLARARTTIQSAFTSQDNFIPSYIFVATWDHVGYFNSRTDKTNTFQCVMATNGVSAFVIFLYADGEIQWTTGDASGGMNGVGGTQAQVGFNAGDGVRFATVPNSQTPEIINISSTSNVGIPGVWIFRVDQGEIIAGGCSLEPNATLTLAPRVGNMLGGTPVQVAGPCFQPTDSIICTFAGIEVIGVYIREMIAVCVSPQLTSIGRILFQMTVYTNSGGVKFQGEDIFFSTSPDRGHAVDFDYPDLLFEPGISFDVSWSPQLIIPFEDPNTYTVDIVLYEYDATSNIWKELETLAADVPNTGERSVTVIADDSCLSDNSINAGVCQVAIKVAVGRASSDSSSAAKLERVGVWSGMAYLALSDELRERCETWCDSQPANIGQEILDRLLPCPPTIQRAIEDTRFEEERLSSVIDVTMYDIQWRRFFHEGATSCFRQTAFFRESGQQCCYNVNGFLITGAPDGGTVELVAPEANASRHFEVDVKPYIYCCKGMFSNCGAYYDKRPSNDGTGYELPVPAFMFGDPHIVTLDGLKYTFNGRGEFTLTETTDENFIMQGRMIEANTADESLAQATVFSALVCKQIDSDTVQFELSRRGIDVLVNGERVVFDDVSEQDYNNVIVTDQGNNTASALFSNGVNIRVKAENGIISVILLNIPGIFSGATQGLLGTFNSNTSDDLVPKFNTTSIPADSPLQVIHEQFGITWLIDDPDDSLFTYKPGENWALFYDPTFTPTYEPVFPDLDLEAEASELCGGDQFCLFDVAATGRTDIGLSTLEGSQNFESIVQLSLPAICDPPCENGVCVADNSCICASGFEGVTCDQIVYTDCDINLCENGASCLRHVATYICECSSGFTGSLCETFTCDPPCENGVCVANNTCICASGFEGISCDQIVYTDCDVNLCENGASCLRHEATYICECSSGFTGSLCETFTCDPSCENGGICVSHNTCNCAIGFEGATCSERAVDDSENSIPVIIGATVGGIVLLLVIVTVVCISVHVARRHKSLQQREAPTQMEMKECKAYGISTFSMGERSSASPQQDKIKMPASQQQKENKIPASGNAISSAHVTCDGDEVYEEVSDTAGTNGSTGADENVYEPIPGHREPEECIYEPVTLDTDEPNESTFL